MKLLSKQNSISAGEVNSKTGELWPTPWAWRTTDGLYVSKDVDKKTNQPKEVWLYLVLPTAPLTWEPTSSQLSSGARLQNILEELGARSKATLGKTTKYSKNREVHIVSIGWEAPAKPSDPATPDLAKYQLDAYGSFLFPKKAVFVGVKLKAPSLELLLEGSDEGFFSSFKKVAQKYVSSVLGESVPDLSVYEKDLADISPILRRNGCTLPSDEQYAQLESWFNLGQGPDKTMIENKDHILVDGVDKLEMNILMEFEAPRMSAPSANWVYEAMTHYSPARVVSMRAELEPPDVSRERARRAQRRVMADIEEQQSTQELERAEYGQIQSLAKSFEDLTVRDRQALLTRVSVIMARRAEARRETFRDALNEGYGIKVKPLEHRQMWALEHTLPCSRYTLDIFPQDLSISMVAHSGVWGFEQFGDGYGAFMGVDHTTLTPTYMAAKGPKSAANRNGLGPICAVIGEPGSGKTFLLQNTAVQYALDGINTIMVDPKSSSDLSPTCDLIDSILGPGSTEIIKLSSMESDPGALDPFRWALGENNQLSPTAAAEVLADFIASVMGDSITRTDRNEIASGLKNAAEAGAQCAMHALAGIENKELVRAIQNQLRATSLFGIAFSSTPRPPLAAAARFTLFQFDRKLELPSSNSSPKEWTDREALAMAINRLVFQAMLETLMSKKGGVLIMDEAWTFLSHPASMKKIDHLGREGRSMDVLLMLATQRIADVLTDDQDLESYISRVYTLKMADPNEIAASLRLMRMEDTPTARAFIENAAPKRTEEGVQRPAMGLIRDADGRFGAIVFGPTPVYAAEAFSTRPEDVRNREAQKKAAVAHQLNSFPSPPLPQ